MLLSIPAVSGLQTPPKQNIDLKSSIEDAPTLQGQELLLKELHAVLGNSSEFQNRMYLLSQYVRFDSVDRALNTVQSNSELVKSYVYPQLTRLGYSRTERDPNVWVNPHTRAEGWIVELPEGDGLWHAPFIVAGHFEGIVSRDLQRAIRRGKEQIEDDLIAAAHQSRNYFTSRDVMLFESPWRELRTEIRSPSDVKVFFDRHAELEMFFAALFSFTHHSLARLSEQR